MKNGWAVAVAAVWMATIGMWNSDVLAAQEGAAASVPKVGSLSGRVVVSGPPPTDEVLQITRDVALCGKTQLAGKYVVSASGGVKNAVVWLEGVPGGAPVPQRDTVMTIQKCRMAPRVSLGFVGRDFVLRNEDPVMHNSHLYLQFAYQRRVSQRPMKLGATVYNVAFPKKRHEVRKHIKPFLRYTEDTGHIEVRCNIHPWERAYFFVFDHPYAAVTDGEGAFTMADVPPGQYTLRYWHEGYGEGRQTVEIKAGKAEALEIRVGK